MSSNPSISVVSPTLNDDMNTLPLISVIIPVYNRVAFIAEAIESVLNQTYEPIELIVVDGRSTDGTAETIERYAPRLRHIDQENAGAAFARNTGIAAANGTFLAFLDSDDIWLPHKLERQMETLQANPTADVVFGHAEQFFDPSVDEAFKARINATAEVIPAQSAVAMLIRREFFHTIGNYNTDVLTIDVEWYGRLLEHKPNIVMLPDVVFRRRIHHNNMTLRKQKSISADYLKVLRQKLQRSRAAAR